MTIFGRIAGNTAPIPTERTCMKTIAKEAKKNNPNLLNFEERKVTMRKVLSPNSARNIITKD